MMMMVYDKHVRVYSYMVLTFVVGRAFLVFIYHRMFSWWTNNKIAELHCCLRIIAVSYIKLLRKSVTAYIIYVVLHYYYKHIRIRSVPLYVACPGHAFRRFTR